MGQMNRSAWCGQIALVALAALAGGARGEEMPLSVQLGIPLGAGIVQSTSGHTYAWISGSYQSGNAPAINPGQSAALSIASPAYTPLRATDPFPNGVGLRGAVGAILPSGTFARGFGSDVRIELATAFASFGGPMVAEPPSADDAQLFGGGNALLGCTAIVNCLPAAMSPSSYQTLQLDLRVASDFHLGPTTVTPSLTLFSKDARGQESYYAASGTSSWTEWGARLGLDSTLALDAHQSFGLRASVGGAYRSANFASSEIADFSNPASAPVLASGHWNGVPFIGSAEASYLLRPAPGYLLRAFAGLTYDSRTPASAESLGLDPSVVGAISYQALTSYYYGIGLKIRFDANGN
jgi:hypothetical protein